MDDFLLFLPETAVLVAGLLTLLMSAFELSYRAVWRISLILAAAVVAVTAASLFAEGEPFFPGIYGVDIFSQLLKLGIAGGLFLTVLASGNVATIRSRIRADVPIFLFVSAAGMMMLVSATELLTLYVALELSAYGLYIMAALHTSKRLGGESGVKYTLFGAASSAVSLYGISLIFAITGETQLGAIMAYGVSAANVPLLLVGVLLTLAGLFFKLGVFPFHSWVPDTYQGAPHQIATFIGTASKVAAVGVLIRILAIIAPDPGHMVEIMVALCVLSMTVGNLAALVQKDLKRLLAYSTVAHAGYIMLGLLTFTKVGVAAAIFYVMVYVPIAFCPFLVVCAIGRDGTNPTLESIAGLHRRSPLMAVVLLIGMFGLAGIPPTPGFVGKWFLFSAALDSGWFWLVLVGAVNATISLYYYLVVVKAAYLSPKASENSGENADSALPDLPSPSPTLVVAAAVAILVIAVAGFYPAPLWDLARDAAALMMPS